MLTSIDLNREGKIYIYSEEKILSYKRYNDDIIIGETNGYFGDNKLIFAYPSSLTTAEPKFEYFTMAWESVGGFEAAGTVQVADVRGGDNGLAEYKVYTYTPAAPYATETKYRVSF